MFKRYRSLSQGRDKDVVVDVHALMSPPDRDRTERSGRSGRPERLDQVVNMERELSNDPYELQINIAKEELRREMDERMNKNLQNLELLMANTVQRPNKLPVKLRPDPCIVDDSRIARQSPEEFQKLFKIFLNFPEFKGSKPREFLSQFNNIVRSNFRDGRLLAASDAMSCLTLKLSSEIYVQYPEIEEMSFFELFDSLITRYDTSEIPERALDKLIEVHKSAKDHKELFAEAIRLYSLLSLSRMEKFRLFLIAMKYSVPRIVRDELSTLSDTPPNVERIISRMRPFTDDIDRFLEKRDKNFRKGYGPPAYRQLEFKDEHKEPTDSTGKSFEGHNQNPPQNSEHPVNNDFNGFRRGYNSNGNGNRNGNGNFNRDGNYNRNGNFNRDGNYNNRNGNYNNRNNNYNGGNGDYEQRKRLRCHRCGIMGHIMKYCRTYMCNLCGEKHRTVICTKYPSYEPISGECERCREAFNIQLRHKTKDCKQTKPQEEKN